MAATSPDRGVSTEGKSPDYVPYMALIERCLRGAIIEDELPGILGTELAGPIPPVFTQALKALIPEETDERVELRARLMILFLVMSVTLARIAQSPGDWLADYGDRAEVDKLAAALFDRATADNLATALFG